MSSVLELISKNVDVASLLQKRNDGTATKEELDSLQTILTNTQDYITNNLNKQKIIIDQLAELQAKKQLGIVDKDTDNTINALTSQLKDLKLVANTIAIEQNRQLAIEEVKKQQEKDTKKAIESSKSTGSINFAEPADLYEYITRVQGLNLYSRNRTCDDNFKSLLAQIGLDMHIASKELEEIKKAIETNVFK